MTGDRPPAHAPGNRLLARLSEADYRLFLPHLKPVKLAFNQVLYEPRGRIDYAYFPIGSVASALTIMQDGNAIEVATVGNEGLVGHTAATGAATSPVKMIIQINDGALRIDVTALRQLVASNPTIRSLIEGYSAAYLAQVTQSVACNGLHRLEQRCCRWLLMSRERLGSDDLRLTHEFLAIMLGARRASVTEALKPLQEAALVRSERGRIRILDRAGLEARSCECYRVVKDEYDRLLGAAG